MGRGKNPVGIEKGNYGDRLSDAKRERPARYRPSKLPNIDVHESLTAQFCYSLGDQCKWASLPESSIGTLAFGGERVPASMANEKGWRRRPKDTEYTLDFAATLGGKLVAGKKLYHPVKCAADAKLGALARGMAQGHNSMETMSTPRQDMLVGALEGFLEDLPSS